MLLSWLSLFSGAMTIAFILAIAMAKMNIEQCSQTVFTVLRLPVLTLKSREKLILWSHHLRVCSSNCRKYFAVQNCRSVIGYSHTAWHIVCHTVWRIRTENNGLEPQGYWCWYWCIQCKVRNITKIWIGFVCVASNLFLPYYTQMG